VDSELLVEKRADGMRLLVALVRAGIDVTVAAWVERSERSHLFVIGTAAVDAGQFNAAYRIVVEHLTQNPDSTVELIGVLVLGTTEPLVRALVAARDRRDGGHAPVRANGASLAPFGIERAYIYPRVIGALTRDEVIRKVAVMLDDRSPATPATISRRSGPELRGVPFGLEVTNTGTGRVLEVKIRSAADGATLSVPVDDVANIL
jgi:hypothetical protein